MEFLMNQYGKIMQKNTNIHTIPVCKADCCMCKKNVKVNKMYLHDFLLHKKYLEK